MFDKLLEQIPIKIQKMGNSSRIHFKVFQILIVVMLNFKKVIRLSFKKSFPFLKYIKNLLLSIPLILISSGDPRKIVNEF